MKNLIRYLLSHKKVALLSAAGVIAAVVVCVIMINSGGVRVCLDAGHGGSDVGAIGANDRYEKDDNLAMTLAVRDELKKMGIKTVLTRKSDKFVSLQKRSRLANRKNATVFVSIHRNSAEDKFAAGFEAWVHSEAPQKDTLLAQTIMEKLEQEGISKNRGVKNGSAGGNSDYHINSATNMPSCLLELGFISNAGDNALFDSSIYLYARAIAEGIAEYLEQ